MLDMSKVKSCDQSDDWQVSLFDAEVLLRKYDWSKESLLDAWINDSEATCQYAGIQSPQGLQDRNNDLITYITSLIVQGHHSDLAVSTIKLSIEDDSIEVTNGYSLSINL